MKILLYLSLDHGAVLKGIILNGFSLIRGRALDE